MDSLDFQALRIDTTDDAAYFFSLLSCCRKELSVQDLARIAASSKKLNEACVAIARRDLVELLEAAAAQTAEAEAKCTAPEAAALRAYFASISTGSASGGETYASQKGWSAYDPYADFPNAAAYQLQVHTVAWLLRAAPVEAASDAAVECVLSMPAVAEQAAVQLVTAGMRVSYAQLLSAADRMVKGVEVWTLAQQQLGVQTDIPEDAVDISRGNGSVFERWVSCCLFSYAALHACPSAGTAARSSWHLCIPCCMAVQCEL
jgi:hypothetical protein